MNDRISFILENKLSTDLLMNNLNEISDIEFTKNICFDLIYKNKIKKFQEIKDKLNINDEVIQYVYNILLNPKIPMSLNMFKLWEEKLLKKINKVDDYFEFQVMFNNISQKDNGKIINHLYLNNNKFDDSWFVFSALEQGLEFIVKKGLPTSNFKIEIISKNKLDKETLILKFNKNIFESVLKSNNKNLIKFVFDNYYKNITDKELSPSQLIKNSITDNNIFAVDYLLNDFSKKEEVKESLMKESKYNVLFFASLKRDYSSMINHLKKEYEIEDRVSIYEYISELHQTYEIQNFHSFFNKNKLSEEYQSKLTRKIKINNDFNLQFLEIIPFTKKDEENILYQLINDTPEITPNLDVFLMKKIKSRDIIERIYNENMLSLNNVKKIDLFMKKLLLNTSLESKEHFVRPRNKI